MRTLTSVIALVAVLGAASPMTMANAQDVSATLAQRLSNAVTQSEPATTTSSSSLPAASYTAAQLDKLVSPIALYPDALLAQVLVASTYPDQVNAAGALIARAPNMSDSDLADAVSAGQWDQSILVLLSGFPSVLSRMADQTSWTSDLGTAFASDHAGVMSAIQTMRSEAMDKGNLTSNTAQVVSRGDSGITIRPADPKVVYVPQYDPETVYVDRDVAYAGPAPIATGVNPIVAGAIGFGAGLLVSSLWNNSHNSGNDGNHGWANYWHQDAIDWRREALYAHPGPNPAPWAPPPRGTGHPNPAPVASTAPVPAPASANRHRPGEPSASTAPASRPSSEHQPSAAGKTPAHRREQANDAARPQSPTTERDRHQRHEAQTQGTGHQAAPSQATRTREAHQNSQEQRPAEACRHRPNDPACKS